MELSDDEFRSASTGELPIADYKHLPQREVAGHLPSLGPEELRRVLRYENTHRDRTPLVRLLISRLRQLRVRARSRPRTGGYGPAPR
jgi:hypothetical protein